MSRREVVEFISSLENKYPVDKWRVTGIDIWPLLKIQSFFFWFEKSEETKRESSEVKKKTPGKTGVKEILKSLPSWMKLAFLPVKKSKYVFSGAASHRVDFSGTSMNRYFDPMMDYLESNDHNCVLIEQSHLADKKYYRRDRMIELRKLFPFANAIVKLKYRKQITKEVAGLPGFLDCLQEMEMALPELPAAFLKRQMIYMAQTVLVWGYVFDKIFDRLKPTYAFGLCYYTLQMLGMNLSARRKGVVSIDMQHGTQGELHVGYSSFNTVPADGFTMLPEIFWCWDNASATTIELWVRRQKFHQVLVGGNPWVTFLSGDKAQQQWLPTSKKIILYTLQPVEPLLEEYIMEAIQEMSPEFQWWLRLHPRQFKDRARLENLLRDRGLLSVVNIEDACNLPLPLILQHTAVHVSKYSGSIIEASLLHVMNVVIDEIGVAAFQAQLSEGRAVAFLDKNGQKFASLLRQLSTRKADAVENVNFADVLKKHFLK
jgi:hypothetical protein